MFKVMVVEDEPIERQALVLMLQHNFYELVVVAEEKNGFDAVTKCRQLQPDLVLIDVGIPGINGLQAISEIQTFAPDTRFIIISSHDSFEYAQKAIQLGVEDYLLKPVRLATLKEAITASLAKKESKDEASAKTTALLGRMDMIRPLVENDFIYALISGGPPEELRQMLSFLGFGNCGGFCMVVSEKSAFRRPLTLIKTAFTDVGNRVVGGFYNNAAVLCILFDEGTEKDPLEELADFASMVLNTNGYREFQIGVSNMVKTASGWNSAYGQAVTALQHARSAGCQVQLFSKTNTPAPVGVPTDYLSAGAGVLSRAILDRKTNQYADIAGKIALVLMTGNEFEQAKGDVYKLLILVEQNLIHALPALKKQIDSARGADARLFSLETPKQLETALLNRIAGLSDVMKDFRGVGKNSIVDNVILHIRGHYQEEISLDNIAREVDISPYYLSKLLKRHTGKTCTELIAEQRIAEAKKLLRKNFSSKEVAYMVGFNSQNYFAKIFKKYTGATPGEYRNAKNLAEE